MRQVICPSGNVNTGKVSCLPRRDQPHGRPYVMFVRCWVIHITTGQDGGSVSVVCPGLSRQVQLAQLPRRQAINQA